MTVAIQPAKTIRKYTGLSADIKPVLDLEDIGALFFEIDTLKEYKWFGTSWGLVTTTVIEELTYKTDSVSLLEKICYKLDVLIEYEVLMHKIDLSGNN